MNEKARQMGHSESVIKQILETKVKCQYCGNAAQLVDSRAVYKKSYGNIWICYPCDAYVGCHKGTYKPKGSLANIELRKARIRAHDAFDYYWKTGNISRKRAYLWLADRLGIKFNDCHIGMFDIETCDRVVEICRDI